MQVDNSVISWEGDGLRDCGDAGLTTALLPAMATDARNLEIDRPIAQSLSRATGTLQDVFMRWLPDANRVTLNADTYDVNTKSKLGVFFTGGVDSFHAVMKHRDSIDKLVYVEGFDIPETKPHLQEQVTDRLRFAAEEMELSLTVLKTNVKIWSDKSVTWDMYHGAALATAAHLLSAQVGTMIIPSTYAYEELFPWGSHPLTDPCWSGATRILHSGSELSRPDKIALIAQNSVAQEVLRVCWRNPDQQYNCGRCEKCLRTMTTLAAFGHLEDFSTFPDTLTAKNIQSLQVRSASARRFAQTNISMLRESGLRPDLQTAWSNALQHPSKRERLIRGSAKRTRQVARRFLRRTEQSTL